MLIRTAALPVSVFVRPGGQGDHEHALALQQLRTQALVACKRVCLDTQQLSCGIPYCLCCNLQVTKETMDMRSALQQLRMQACDASIQALKTLSWIHLFP